MVTTKIQKGKTSILVHDDYCKTASSEVISDVVQEISKIVSNAYSRATGEKATQGK